ncbi:hypothetical protein DESC_240048 [Desulfosarcina cetonica]|nr:hypothetical protein DESC_240048 [Desulfosarcina cetonica]
MPDRGRRLWYLSGQPGRQGGHRCLYRKTQGGIQGLIAQIDGHVNDVIGQARFSDGGLTICIGTMP